MGNANPPVPVLDQLNEAERVAGCKIVHMGETTDGLVVFNTKSASERDQYKAALVLRASGYVFGRKVLKEGRAVRAWGKRRRPVSNLKDVQAAARRKRLL